MESFSFIKKKRRLGIYFFVIIFISIISFLGFFLYNNFQKNKLEDELLIKMEREIEEGDLYAFRQDTKDSALKLRNELGTYIYNNKHIENFRIGQLIYVKLNFSDLTQDEIDFINVELDNSLGFMVKKKSIGIFALNEIQKLGISIEKSNLKFSIYQKNNSKSLDEVKCILDNSSFGLVVGKLVILDSKSRVKSRIELEDIDFFRNSYNFQDFYYDVR